MKTEFLGNCIGVRLKDRGKDDKHQLIVLLIEDDENWYEKVQFSSFWLDEAIAILKKAKKYLKNNYAKDKDGFGFSKK